MCCPNIDSAFMRFRAQVSHGEMIKCDAPKVLHRTCFRFLSQHTDCVGAVVQGRLVPSGLCRPQQGTQGHLVCCLVVMRSNASISERFSAGSVRSAQHCMASRSHPRWQGPDSVLCGVLLESILQHSLTDNRRWYIVKHWRRRLRPLRPATPALQMMSS